MKLSTLTVTDQDGTLIEETKAVVYVTRQRILENCRLSGRLYKEQRHEVCCPTCGPVDLIPQWHRPHDYRCKSCQRVFTHALAHAY